MTQEIKDILGITNFQGMNNVPYVGCTWNKLENTTVSDILKMIYDKGYQSGLKDKASEIRDALFITIEIGENL